MNGPLPTILTLLADLESFSQGTKVRFLGCITAYCTKRALLTLEHNHPIGNSVKVMVDVGLLLNSLTSNETRIGEWLNVMGYITSNPVPKSNLANREIGVQAIVLWSPNTFDLVGYERSLDSKKKET